MDLPCHACVCAYPSLQLRSTSGALVVTNTLVANSTYQGSPATVISSETGPVVINTLLSSGIAVQSGGFISARALASGYAVSTRAPWE